MKKKIWIDLINPSHPLFFKSLVKELQEDYTIYLTLRNRGETVRLAEEFGLNGKVYGQDFEDPIKKILSIIFRTINLSLQLKKFDYAISFENPMSIVLSKIRGAKSILLLDNDLKYKVKNNYFQDLESKIKMQADNIIIPLASKNVFDKFKNNLKISTFHGYKEDFYIADYKPDERFLGKLPIEDYIIIRGESFASFYVDKKKTLLQELFNLFEKNKINIIFLTRDKSDLSYTEKSNVYILKNPLNGLDLIYYSKAVLTGSGTMAREAACMGKTAVSFFPGNSLLSVDSELVKAGKIFHSRDPKEIVEYVLNNYGKMPKLDFKHNTNVKKEIIDIIRTCMK